MLLNKTKIIATLGPASELPETMFDMIKAGVNAFRINFSHSLHEYASKLIKQVREFNANHELNIAILADLQGPKLRIGKVEDGTILKKGDKLTFTNKEIIGDRSQVYINYNSFPSDVKVDEKILIDDGNILLRTTYTNGIDYVETKVIQGGPLKSYKGINLPHTKIFLPCLTQKDLTDLKFAIEQKVEWIALSFVRSSKDVEQLKAILRENNAACKVISKIEKAEAVAEIDNILKVTDAIMIARGDLGVEVPLQDVPLIQKKIVNKCYEMARPVIIATQMMESMIETISPTRAEVNDVANSVLDGADALMLSGETSIGKHPVRVIQTVSKIALHIQKSGQLKIDNKSFPDYKNERFITDSICYSASNIADRIGARAILTMTFSGYTGFKISSYRPKANIIVFTANRSILNTLSLIWGVRGFFYDKMESTDSTFADIKQIVEEKCVVNKGDLIIKIASMPIEDKGITNMLKIGRIA